MNDLTEFRPSTGMDNASIASQGYGMVQYGPTDDKLIVGFYPHSTHSPALSREAGRPIEVTVDHVRIQHPGENLNIVDRPVIESDKQRWPRQWAHYQQGINQIPDGVPLNLLFPDKPHIVKMMRGYNIHTVEQLSNLSAQGISTVGMGAQDWVNAAKRYMERASKGVDHHKFETALAKKDAEIAALTRQIAEVTALVRQQQQAQPMRAAVPSSNVDFDYQSAQINATHTSTTEPFTAPPAEFVQDLSGMTTAPQAPKRRGRPPKNPQH